MPNWLSIGFIHLPVCFPGVEEFHKCYVAPGTARKVRKGNSQPIPVSVGDVLKDVKVQSMLGWGAFIDVGNGHRGLLHVDEMRWPEGAMAPSAYDCVKEEQSVEVTPFSTLSFLSAVSTKQTKQGSVVLC